MVLARVPHLVASPIPWLSFMFWNLPHLSPHCACCPSTRTLPSHPAPCPQAGRYPKSPSVSSSVTLSEPAPQINTGIPESERSPFPVRTLCTSLGTKAATVLTGQRRQAPVSVCRDSVATSKTQSGSGPPGCAHPGSSPLGFPVAWRTSQGGITRLA